MEIKQASSVAAGMDLASPSTGKSITPTTQAGLTRNQLADGINWLFRHFKAQWPRKFPSIWVSDEAVRESKRQWLETFQSCPHLTQDTLRSGWEQWRTRQWPADNPGEFLSLCHVRPADLGAPDEDRAFREASRAAYPYANWVKWSHKCVYWAAVWTGLGDLAERGERMRAKFNEQYQLALDRADQLDEPPRGQLPERPSKVEPDLEGEGYLSFKAALKKIKGTGVTDEN